MSPRAKSVPPKSKAKKTTVSKFVRTITATPSISKGADVEGIRTPGDRAGTFDLRNANNTWEKRFDMGKRLRIKAPRESHADVKPVTNRPDPLDLLAASNVG